MVTRKITMFFNKKPVTVTIVLTAGKFFRQVDDDNHFRTLKEFFIYHGADLK